MKWRILLIAAAVAACSETDIYPPPEPVPTEEVIDIPTPGVPNPVTKPIKPTKPEPKNG